MKNHTKTLYFDYAATTPCDPEVADIIYSALTDDKLFANASSSHGLAYVAEKSLQHVRKITGELINGNESNIIFTSGATESNNLALLGLSNYFLSNKKTHIISSVTEHKAVLDTIEHLKDLGHYITLVNTNENGEIDLADIEKAITPQTGLISIMHVNNETGVINDIKSIGKIAHQYNVTFHVDAAQSAGKIPINVQDMNIDLLSICAHKFYGPKGIGALYIDSDYLKQLSPLFYGGGQEYSKRPGTYATHQIIGLGKTIELALNKMDTDLSHSRYIREIFLKELNSVISHINGSNNQYLPNILNISIDGVDAITLLTSLQSKIALANGSACNSGAVSASHVLMAMGLTGNRLSNAIRISFGRYTTANQAVQACEIIKADIARIKSLF